MKKGTKVCLILSVVLAVAGIAMIITGAVIGINPGNILKRVHVKTHFSNIEGKVENEPFTPADGNDFVIKAAGANVEIRKTSDDTFSIEDSKNVNVWDYSDKEIRLISDQTNAMFTGDNTIVVYVPEDYEFGEVTIECGGSNVEAEKLNAKNVNIDCGAGNVEIRDIDTNNVDVECGAGNTYLKGSISGNASVECGVGNVDISVDQEEKYYNYSLECALGNLSLNNNEYSGFASERNIDNGAHNIMDIECAMGNVSIVTN